MSSFFPIILTPTTPGVKGEVGVYFIEPDQKALEAYDLHLKGEDVDMSNIAMFTAEALRRLEEVSWPTKIGSKIDILVEGEIVKEVSLDGQKLY